MAEKEALLQVVAKEGFKFIKIESTYSSTPNVLNNISKSRDGTTMPNEWRLMNSVVANNKPSNRLILLCLPNVLKAIASFCYWFSAKSC